MNGQIHALAAVIPPPHVTLVKRPGGPRNRFGHGAEQENEGQIHESKNN